MNRSYTVDSPYSLAPTERRGSFGDEPPIDYDFNYQHDYADYADYDEYTDEYADFAAYDEARIDRRWMWVAGVAGVILFIAVVTTGVILGGGDSGSVSATATSAAPLTTAPATTSAAPSAAPVVPTLPPETVTTLTPTAEAPPTTQAAPAPTTQAAPPPPAPSPRTITYRVTGNRQLIDLITVIYTDARGALQTDLNVALPWAKTVVLEPGVELKSVTATSVAGQLNCSITDAAGNLIVAQNNNTMITTCTN